MNIVIDIEYYHQKKRLEVGPIKQVGAFKFDDNYRIIDIFDMTVTKYTPLEILYSLFGTFIAGVDQLYVWDKANDSRILSEQLDVDFTQIKIHDVQTYFKDVDLASLSAVNSALEYDNEGRHNALVDAEYTFEIIKHFNLNHDASRDTLVNFVNLLKQNGSKKEEKKKLEVKPKNDKVIENYGLFHPGSMRKIGDDHYHINNERLLLEMIEKIITNEYPICIDGQCEVDYRLQALIEEDADIVFSNANKFNKIAKKYPNKLIIVMDEEENNEYLAAFVAKKSFKKFARLN